MLLIGRSTFFFTAIDSCVCTGCMCGSQKTLSRLTFSRTFIRILNTVLKRKGESSNNEVLFLVPVASAAYGEFLVLRRRSTVMRSRHISFSLFFRCVRRHIRCRIRNMALGTLFLMRGADSTVLNVITDIIISLSDF